LLVALACASALGVTACSSDDSSTSASTILDGGTGGSTSAATGGSGGGSGGSSADGGATSGASTGGAQGNKGGTTSATGAGGSGTSSSGGASMAGGTSATGGSPSGGNGGNPSSGGRTGAGGASGGGGAAPLDCSAMKDACPMASGLAHACETRFALGLNYAWHNFAGDFGGITPWGQKGVSQDQGTYDADLKSMHTMGASVIRWWVFPDFRSDGVTFDANGDPSGISATASADVAAALSLAKKNDVYLVLTIFSFDDFRPDRTESGIMIRGMSQMVSSASRRSKLVANIVTPLAQAVASSADRTRLLGWDVINEPEWAVQATGNAPGGQDFSPNSDLSPVALADMKALIGQSAAALKKELPDALTSVGWAAVKWHWAFSDVALDFDQPHIYGWVDQYWPYTKSPSALGYTDRPVVMGEFFLANMPFSDGGDNATIQQILDAFWNEGYAGAWPWQYNEHPGSTLIQPFAMSKGCPAAF
jgi:hypothetical protein